MPKQPPPSMNSSIFFRRDFLAARPYLRPRQKRGFELSAKTPPSIRKRALALRAPCVRCSSSSHPFRKRKGASEDERGNKQPAHVFFSFTCPTEVDAGCNRSGASKEASVRLWEMLIGT